MQARNLLLASYLPAFVMLPDFAGESHGKADCLIAVLDLRFQTHFANSSLLAMQQKSRYFGSYG